MTTPTFDLLDSVTLSSSASSVSFSGISQSYRDLVLVADALGDAIGYYQLTLNSDSAANYSRVLMTGNGSGAVSIAQTSRFIQYNALLSTGARILHTLSLFDYSATDKHKTYLVRGNAATGSYKATEALAGRWANTSAVTSLALDATVNIAAGSTFYLYAIAS